MVVPSITPSTTTASPVPHLKLHFSNPKLNNVNRAYIDSANNNSAPNSFGPNSSTVAGPAWACDSRLLGPATGFRPVWDFGRSSGLPCDYMPGVNSNAFLYWDGSHWRHDMWMFVEPDYNVIGEPHTAKQASWPERPQWLQAHPSTKLLWSEIWHQLPLQHHIAEIRKETSDTKSDSHIIASRTGT